MSDAPAAAVEAARALVDFDWLAETDDDRQFRRVDLHTFAAVPMDRIRRLVIATTDRRVPAIDVRVDPNRGERVSVFARRCARLSVAGGADPAIQSMLVVEVKLAHDTDRFVRYYLHPQRGPIISTAEINL